MTHTAPPPLVHPTAVVGRRVAAYAVDLALVAVVVGALLATVGGFGTTEFGGPEQAEAHCRQWEQDHLGACTVDYSYDASYSELGAWEATTVPWVPPGAGLVVFFLVFPVVQGLTGATPGKLALGLRVVDRQGRPIGLGRSFLRTALWAVNIITCGLPVVDGILLLVSKLHQRVGDSAAGTYVVATRSVGTPVPDLETFWPTYLPPGGTGWPGAAGGIPGPSAPGQPSWAPGNHAQPAAPIDPPHWDPVRGTHLQYDRPNDAWLQWDAEASRWKPVDT